jgi:hypothetical protein
MSKFSTDNRDKRSGAYDPIDKDGLPQPHQVKDRTTPYEAAQPGADVRADALRAQRRFFRKAWSESRSRR